MNETGDGVSGGPETATSRVEADVLAIAALRRDTRRGDEAFFVPPYWTRLHDAQCRIELSAEEREAARAILGRIQEHTSAVIEGLPALSSVGSFQTGAAIDERFVSILSSPTLRNLDLWRRQHRLDEYDWNSTDMLDAGLESLIEELESVKIDDSEDGRYMCIWVPKIQSSCDMSFQYVTEEAEKAGTAYCVRETDKVVVTDILTGDEIHITKRSEFAVAIERLPNGVKARLSRLYYGLVDNPKIDTDKTGFSQAHEALDQLITQARHAAFKPVFTTLYGYRRRPLDGIDYIAPGELRPYPELERLLLGALSRKHSRWVKGARNR